MLTIEYVSIDTIKPYEKNAKLHPQEQVEQIKKSIESFGFNDPLALWHNEIIEGHGRYLAAKELELTELPVIKLDGLTDEQRRAYMLVHNQLTLNSGFDIDLLNEELKNILDFDMESFGFTVENPIESIEGVQEDEYIPQPPEEPITKTGDRYILGNHILLCGDSTKDIGKLMNGKKADLLLTDPPYNVNYLEKHIDIQKAINRTYKACGIKKGVEVSNARLNDLDNDNMSDKEFEDFIYNLIKNAKENTKPGGVFYIFHPSSKEMGFLSALEKLKTPVRQTLIWNKNHAAYGRQDYKWKHEPILYGWFDGAGHYFIDDYTQKTVIEDAIPDYKNMKKTELIELLQSIYTDKKSTTVINEDINRTSDLHPTMKPLKLLARLIRNSTKPGEIVLDTCGGSGSTLMACEQLGRTCYMMEIDPHYCDVIVDRWEKYTGIKAVRG